MRETQGLRRLAIISLSLMVLASCASEQRAPDISNPDFPPYMQLGRDTKGKIVTTYKIGNPYQVAGLWYYPAEDFGYKEVGIASWYGPGFNGKRTANGEVYDMNALTAAHKTLPIPSIVHVTNLENGRTLKLRINDRGPFVEGRIIDLSLRAAELLDVQKKGTARVRVELVPEDSLTLKNLALDAKGQPPVTEMPSVTAAPRALVVAETLTPPVPTPPVGAVTSVPSPPTGTITSSALPPPPMSGGSLSPAVAAPAPGSLSGPGLYVQAGAFTDINNARRLEAQLSGMGKTVVAMADIGGRVFHRVRIGPVLDQATAEQLLSEMLNQGYDGARIVEE
jgi:rare lipoprotein A